MGRIVENIPSEAVNSTSKGNIMYFIGDNLHIYSLDLDDNIVDLFDISTLSPTSTDDIKRTLQHNHTTFYYSTVFDAFYLHIRKSGSFEIYKSIDDCNSFSSVYTDTTIQNSLSFISDVGTTEMVICITESYNHNNHYYKTTDGDNFTLIVEQTHPIHSNAINKSNYLYHSTEKFLIRYDVNTGLIKGITHNYPKNSNNLIISEYENRFYIFGCENELLEILKYDETDKRYEYETLTLTGESFTKLKSTQKGNINYIYNLYGNILQLRLDTEQIDIIEIFDPSENIQTKVCQFIDNGVYVSYYNTTTMEYGFQYKDINFA